MPWLVLCAVQFVDALPPDGRPVSSFLLAPRSFEWLPWADVVPVLMAAAAPNVQYPDMPGGW